jgi:hypothetical protein
VSGTSSSSGGYLLRGAPAYQPRTPWPAGAALLTTIAILAASIFGARFLPALGGLGSPAPGQPYPGTAEEISATGLWMVAAFQMLAVALTLLAATLLGGSPREVLALKAAPAGWHAYAGGVLAMAVLQLVLAGVQHSLLKHDMLADLRPFISLIRGADWALTAAVLGIGAPLSEELLFRGFLLGALAQTRLGFWGAALISTLLWTALHAGYSLIGLAEVFAIGLFLSWLLWRTGSLRVTIFCHALYNSVIALALRVVELPA